MNWRKQAKRFRLKQLRKDAFAVARASGWVPTSFVGRWNDWIDLPPEFVPDEPREATVEDLYR